MAVTVNSATSASAETPTAAIVRVANTVLRVTDSLGRVIGARRVKPLERLRLFKALGGDLAANQMYLGTAVVAACCVEIDGEPVPFPASELAIEALVDRLGDEGLEAIGKAAGDNFGAGAVEDTVTAAKN